MDDKHTNILIIGAGLSGIGAAYHIEKDSPQKDYLILESRDQLGGTWDLFRYPGIRSDSDMTTMGFRFKPWKGEKLVAEGGAILDYLHEIADENNIKDKIQYHSHVNSVSWSSEEARWTIEYKNKIKDLNEVITCDFLYFCVGYYDYDEAYEPEFKGRDNFKGQIIHPQNWPNDLDYSGKRVVVIGSGATAVTLIPSMAEKTKHITMLQRSPTYYMIRPNKNPLGNFIRKITNNTVAYYVMRWQNINMQSFFFKRARKYPQRVKDFLIGLVKDHLPENFDVDRHFTPPYNPWDQRLCLVPDGDLFNSINDGKASVVTDHIEEFITDGVKLKSGEKLKADIIITATGFNVLLFGNIDIKVDNKIIDSSKSMTYKGMMVSNVPNLIMTFGYTNASWTLRADLTAEYACRLFNYMDKHGYKYCQPTPEGEIEIDGEWLDFNSGYVLRVLEKLPRQGARDPWRNTQNYKKDVLQLRYGRITDKELKFI
jgi:cation diffusion facilitator CzcD-associated flavoprotein CzcO|tara:strand:+ start:344 stop:1795 length:1452 start_codon:yes stop_codon:yes gene_type:complete